MDPPGNRKETPRAGTMNAATITYAMWYDYERDTCVLRRYFMKVFVLARVHERHPDIEDIDVLTALSSVMVDVQRDDGTWMCIGLDGHGRNLEILYNKRGENLVVYHAFTPPTKKFMREIEQLRRQS